MDGQEDFTDRQIEHTGTDRLVEGKGDLEAE